MRLTATPKVRVAVVAPSVDNPIRMRQEDRYQ
jgi:hypothetical protein